ncbi:AAA family ATPase [Terrisporobacter sp.]
MRFRKIKFENYRCFLCGEINFTENNKENINVIIAPNGGGKTEILFSFWWVLYGFDFKSLNGKENTPYALNSGLYTQLENDENKEMITCSVTIEFEHEDIIYRLKRSCDFRKTKKIIKVDEYQELSSYRENGELSLPERDLNKIKRKLNQIIPKKILYGIIFDGERMKQLSSSNETSVTAIEGVIRDITNVELLELCKENYEALRRDNLKEIKRFAKKKKLGNLSEITTNLQNKYKIQEVKRKKLKSYKEDLDHTNNELERISRELEQYEESKIFEMERQTIKKQLIDEERRNEGFIKSFAESLKSGYILSCNKLFGDVKQLVSTEDVPAGLTVEAVKSILKRNKCICGNDLNELEISKLNNLILSLPPDNINSTICEMIRQTELRVKDTKKEIQKDYKLLEESNKKITELKKKIASLSSQILEEGKLEVQKLELDNEKNKKNKWKLDLEIKNLDKELYTISEDIEELKRYKSELANTQEETKLLEGEYIFINKCIRALENITRYNKEVALKAINSKLQDAYLLLSEDVEYGRRIHIIQYINECKYQLVSYYEKKLEDTLTELRNNGKIAKLQASGKNEDEIRELAINLCKESNSTGQSKINTFAFVKAILDYSKESRDDDSTEVQKEYPLLIDAPFGDIFGENLIKAATNLKSFTNQIILMVSQDTFDAVEQYIGNYVGNIYNITKKENASCSIITKEELVYDSVH